MSSSVRLLFSLFLGMAIVSCCNAVNAQLLVNDWDTDLETWRFDFGAPGSTISQDPTEGSPDNAMGALKLEMPFNVAEAGNNKFLFTGDLFGSEMDFTGYEELLFDIKIDQTSALDAFGNHGFFEFVTREGGGYAYNSVFGTNLPAGNSGWITYSVPTTIMAATRAYSMQLYGGPDQNIDGDVTVWIDNIRLVSAVPEPTTGLLGLIVVTFGAMTSRKRS